MPIEGVIQKEIIDISENIRLRKYDGKHDFALPWYQDVDTVYMLDGKKDLYDMDRLERMYTYLDKRYELYFIEILENGVHKPIGDVAFSCDDMPIIIGDKKYRNKGISKKVVSKLIERGRELNFKDLNVRCIYNCNEPSKKLFTSLGFKATSPCNEGLEGMSYKLNL